MATLGPYTLTGSRFRTDHSRLEIAVRTADADVAAAEKQHWVLKLGDGVDSYEMDYVQKLKGKVIRNCVEFPEEPALFSGSTSDGHLWYALRKYDATVDPRNSRWHPMWQRIGRDILCFLEDLHRLGLAHLDIKPNNILYDAKADCFRVCDFEHMVEAEEFDDKPLCEYDNRTRWYYTILGGEQDQPCQSFRMDLEALGFTLWLLTWPTLSSEPARFPYECEARMYEEMSVCTVEETLALRALEIGTVAPPALQAYYAAIQEVPWVTKEAPPAEFYERLRTIFTAE